jgi:hypothetical protein
MTTPSLAQALQRRIAAQQLAKRTYVDCFVASALHDFWCQVALCALLLQFDGIMKHAGGALPFVGVGARL